MEAGDMPLAAFVRLIYTKHLRHDIDDMRLEAI
jgi:hypothetical protein